nr:MAG TPA: hypothetical protein [Caudoviricetes sp.]
MWRNWRPPCLFNTYTIAFIASYMLEWLLHDNVIQRFSVCNTVPTHQNCLITYRRAQDWRVHPTVPIYSLITQCSWH